METSLNSDAVERAVEWYDENKEKVEDWKWGSKKVYEGERMHNIILLEEFWTEITNRLKLRKADG